MGNWRKYEDWGKEHYRQKITTYLWTTGDVQFDLGSDVEGDMYYRGSDSLVHRIGIGEEGQVLTSQGGVPVWADATGGSGGIEEEEDPIFTAHAAYNVTNALISNWTTTYNNEITGAAFSGTTTKTLTLTQRDGGVITADFTDLDTLFTLYTEDSSTLHFSGDGTESTPLSADVQVSSTPNNGIITFNDGIYSANTIKAGVVYGGIVTWVEDYTYHVSAAGYYINGVFHTSEETTITLSSPDGSFNRIDSIVVTDEGLVEVLEGTPSSNPAEPSLDPATQLQLSFVLVETGTTLPDIVTDCIYQENLEWTTAASNGRINPNYTTLPCSGSKSIQGNTTINNDNIKFTRPGGLFSPLTAGYTLITFKIRSAGAWGGNGNQRRLVLQWQNSGTLVGSAVNLSNGAFGFDTSNTTDCQTISIPLSAFSLLASSQVNEFLIRVVLNNGSIGWVIDDICIQGQPVPQQPVSNKVTSISFSGTITKTLTLTQSNGETLTATFNDASGSGGDGNDYVDGVSFNTADGVLTLTRTGVLSDLTVDLDGRYLTSFTENDPVALAKTITLNEGTGISITGTATQSLTDSPSWTINSDITQYTDEMAQDAVGSILTDSASIDFTYDDTTITATIDSTLQANWNSAYNNQITSGSYSSGTITLNQQDGGTVEITGIPTGSDTNFANSDLTATGNRTHTWGSNTSEITFNSLAGASGFKLSSTSTAATGSTQRLVDIRLSGANANSSQDTRALYVSNTHSGTSSTNYAAYFVANTGTTNRALYAEVTGGAAIEAQATSAAATAIIATATGSGGTAILATSNSSAASIAVSGNSTNGIPGQFTKSTSGTNDIQNVLRIQRSTTGTAATGLGGNIAFYNEVTSGASSQSAAIASTWTNLTASTEDGDLQFFVTLDGTSTKQLTLHSNGDIELHTTSAGIIMKSPDGTKYKATMNNGGTWNIAAV